MRGRRRRRQGSLFRLTAPFSWANSFPLVCAWHLPDVQIEGELLESDIFLGVGVTVRFRGLSSVYRMRPGHKAWLAQAPATSEFPLPIAFARWRGPSSWRVESAGKV